MSSISSILDLLYSGISERTISGSIPSTHSRSFDDAIEVLFFLIFLVSLSKISSLVIAHRLDMTSLLPIVLSK